MDRLILRAPPKLNLRLLVGPRGADGYHPLTTLMVALDGIADEVAVAPAPRRRVDCPGIDGADNLAWRALDALEARVGRALPVAVRITKRIPAQAGLGAAPATRPRPCWPPTASTASAWGTAPSRRSPPGRFGRAVLRARRRPVGRGARRAAAPRRGPVLRGAAR